MIKGLIDRQDYCNNLSNALDDCIYTVCTLYIQYELGSDNFK
jgi:hypothetical protein